jgi:hypothetical protein
MATSPSLTYVKYNKELLMKGSRAFELYEKGNFKELEEHLKLLNAAYLKIKGTK